MKTSVYPCLWFDGKAKEAAEFYCAIFENSRIISETDLVVMFELNGKRHMGLNVGPVFRFNEAVSFVVECETQQEIDYYWSRLTEGG
ncbi:MAG TPA: VOC family protein, partial [Bacteroidales bacterium]|nr:VOC family protein [Bacteroidales bacterium]